MSWHHIISFVLLRDVWNRLVDRQINTDVPEARAAIRQYLLLSDRTLQSHLDTLIERMRADRTDPRPASHYHLEPLNMAEVLRLREAAVWPVWNTVGGPMNTLRIDNPLDGRCDRFRGGLTNEEVFRMGAIERLYDHFLDFVNADAATPAILGDLARAASSARPFLRGCTEPIRYRQDMWVLVNNQANLWRKRRHGEREIPAA
jgi:hypothetical protein